MPVSLSPAVDPAKTIVWGGISHGGGRHSSANANATRIAFDLESSTTLALERLGFPSNSPVIEWQAVEFVSGVSVQRGVRFLTSSETSANVTLPVAVDLSRSFVFVSVAPNSSSSNRDERWTIRSQLTSSTNLELSRNESGFSLDVYWQVVQMEGASVQRGLTTIPSGAASATVSLSSVDTSKSFLITSFRAAARLNGIESKYTARGAITNSTTLSFNRVSSSDSVDIAWEVVTLNDGTTVQRGTSSTSATSNTTLDQTISSVDLNRSFAYISVQGGSGNSASNLDEVAWTAALTSATNLRLQRLGTGTHGTINWEVIQFATAPPVIPTKLAITTVNGGNNPSAGIGFAAVVQAQDASGTPRNVATATGVSLSLKTGTGTLGGNLTGTVAAGTSQVTISGVSYTKAESGVVITATQTSGDVLTAGDSTPFAVDPGAASTLAFTTQPANAIAGSAIPGPPTVTVRDSEGNAVSSSTTSITVAIGSNPGSGV
ncbi:MAG TPA: hypothetical protein VFU31_05965, partial [Candidatus Binatia bacterium]|nr:hypothetical protein [Candidatus Binatia bacterium]